MSEFQKQMENRMMRHVEHKHEIARIQANIDLNLQGMERRMREENQWHFEMLVDEHTLMTAEIDESMKRKLNKDDLANDLGVTKGQLKTPFLLQSVEEGRLTHSQYQKHHYNEPTTSFKIKKKKPRKPRKGKKGQV